MKITVNQKSTVFLAIEFGLIAENSLLLNTLLIKLNCVAFAAEELEMKLS
jgi:hypothetical protein